MTTAESCTGLLLAGEVVLDATRLVYPAVDAVADASVVVVWARVADRPVSERRRTAVVPPRRRPVRIITRRRRRLVHTQPVVANVQQRPAKQRSDQ